MKTHSRKHQTLAVVLNLAAVLIFGLWFIDTHSLLPLSGVILYTASTVAYLYKQRAALVTLGLVFALSPLALSLTADHTPEAHAAALPAPALPQTATIDDMNCWMSTVGWVIVTAGTIVTAPTGFGIIVSAWGQVLAIDSVINYCTSSATGPAFWYLIYWSNGGGGGGSW